MLGTWVLPAAGWTRAFRCICQINGLYLRKCGANFKANRPEGAPRCLMVLLNWRSVACVYACPFVAFHNS
uniref:Secreted protein n=1 Tax=Steinernema glaseri TaxID=37863 RepID=A0A1I7ZS14_9BILA